MDDIQLVNAIKQNDDTAFKQLYLRYYPRLLAYLNTLTHDQEQSKEIAQQAFVNLWVQRQKLDNVQSPKNYLYSIARNTYINEFRKNNRRNEFFANLREQALNDCINDDSEILDQRITRLKHVIETLPLRCKEILKMSKIEGLKYIEIAELLGISLKTVESQMRIAFRKIREGLNDDKLFLFIFCKKINSSLFK